MTALLFRQPSFLLLSTGLHVIGIMGLVAWQSAPPSLAMPKGGMTLTVGQLPVVNSPPKAEPAPVHAPEPEPSPPTPKDVPVIPIQPKVTEAVPTLPVIPEKTVVPITPPKEKIPPPVPVSKKPAPVKPLPVPPRPKPMEMAVKSTQLAPLSPSPQETKAIQPVEAPQKATTGGQKIAASQPGVADGSSTGHSETSAYRDAVRAVLARNKHYPRAAKLRRQEGVVHIEFTLTSNGAVQALRILKSSGSKALDEATLKMVRKSAPFDPFPSTIREAALEFKFPVRYNFK